MYGVDGAELRFDDTPTRRKEWTLIERETSGGRVGVRVGYWDRRVGTGSSEMSSGRIRVQGRYLKVGQKR